MDNILLKDMFDTVKSVDRKLDSMEQRQIKLETKLDSHSRSIEYLDSIVWRTGGEIAPITERVAVVDSVTKTIQLSMNKELSRLEAASMNRGQRLWGLTIGITSLLVGLFVNSSLFSKDMITLPNDSNGTIRTTKTERVDIESTREKD